MTYKAPSLAELQAQCDAFNAVCAIGGRVAVNTDKSDKPVITTTRTEAQIMAGHTAVVWLHGLRSCWCLEHVAPIPESALSEQLAAPKQGHSFDHLAGRGMHELRTDELPAYLSAVAHNHGARSDEFAQATAWVASELERKTNDERIIAVKLAELRARLTAPTEAQGAADQKGGAA